MLKIIKRLDQLDIKQLMTVYEETNQINGARAYRKLPNNLQILYAEQDLYAYLKEFLAVKGSMYAVWAPDGIYKAALRIEQYFDGLIITGLETAPNSRQKGYATALIQEVIGYLKMNCPGRLYSHVEKSNYASLRLHQNFGFKVISDTAIYIDGSFHSDVYTLCLVV